MDKIQELTSKLYAEGVQKGKEEAEEIIFQAQEEERLILDAAHLRAAEIIAMAEKECAELKKNTEAELKLYAAQSSEALKTEIINLLTGKIVSDQVKSAMNDKSFIQQLILEIARNWSKNETLTVGVDDPEALRAYISSQSKNILDKGLKIESINGIQTGFVITPEDGSYTVRFGEEEFMDYFKEFLRPKVQELLF